MNADRKVGDFKVLIRGEERKCPEIQNRKHWPSNTAESIICFIGSRKELFLHQRMPHKEIVRLENIAGMLCHRNMQHCCCQHHITWSKCVLKVAMKKKVWKKITFHSELFLFTLNTPISSNHVLQSTCSLSLKNSFHHQNTCHSCSTVKNVTITHPNRLRSNAIIAWSSS